MIRFVLRKMFHKKWLMAALLIGNILLVSIAAGNPMYTEAALQRMLTNTMSDYVTENGRYPTMAYMVSNITQNTSLQSNSIELFNEADARAAEMPERLGLDSKWLVRNIFLNEVDISPVLHRSNMSSVEVRLGFLTGIEEHSKIINGRMYNTAIEDGLIEVIVSEKALIELNLLLDEVLVIDNMTDAEGNPLCVKVVGVYEAASEDDHYWYKSPSDYSGQLMISEEAFYEIAGDYSKLPYPVMGLWFVIMDYNDVTVDNAQYIYDASKAYYDQHKNITNSSYTDYYNSILENYLKESLRVTVTLRILQIPIYALLAAFIFMVSGQILSMEESEISVIKSRGSYRRQILGIYLLQSIIVSLVSLIIGLPLSSLICQMLGSANAFLEFVSRQALKVRYTSTVLTYGIVAAVLSTCAMVLPALRYSKLTIVAQKQKKRRGKLPWFQRFGLDFILLAISVYGLYSYNGQKAALAQKVLEGQGLDPLMFLASSLFIVGLGLLALRIVPAISWLVYTIGKKIWKPDMYASFLWVLRTRNKQSYIIAFLVITLAVGIFNARTARTINTNEEERISYMAGADIVLQEAWKDNRDEAKTPDSLIGFKLRYTEPDYGKYQALIGGDGAEVVTKVIFDNAATCSTNLGRGQVNCLLMGINTKEFGECVDFKDNLLPAHWYEYLNAMSLSPTSVLVSSNMKEQLGYNLGDSITYRDKDGHSLQGMICGFVDYWPGYSPKTTVIEKDGVISETNNYLVVGHLAYMRNAWGATPYQVWMKAADTTDFIYDFAVDSGTRFTFFQDASALHIEMKNDPIFQGTNGILTLCFVVALLLCAVGFLIYWILSIRSRTLLLGIFRAMGMTMGEIIHMLFNEQFFISVVSIALGIGAGMLTSELYVPLVQIAYASVDTVIPLEIISQTSDMVRLLMVVVLMLLVCMAILGTIISKIHISQALKLGED